MKKYIEFKLLERKGKVTGSTDVYQVIGVKTQEILGTISWYGPWRQYVFWPHDNTVWSADCLTTVDGFLCGLMDARRKKKEERG